MMNGNKGEWSELYTLLKLAADGKLYAADGNINKIENIYYDILQIIRKQKDDNWKYIRNGKIKIVSEKTGEIVDEISISEFKTNAELLLEAIQNVKTKKGDFQMKIKEIKTNGIGTIEGIVIALEEEYGCEIPADDVAAMATVEDVVNYLKNNGIED